MKEIRFALYDFNGFRGYKVDTFWSLAQNKWKTHSYEDGVSKLIGNLFNLEMEYASYINCGNWIIIKVEEMTATLKVKKSWIEEMFYKKNGKWKRNKIRTKKDIEKCEQMIVESEI